MSNIIMSIAFSVCVLCLSTVISAGVLSIAKFNEKIDKSIKKLSDLEENVKSITNAVNIHSTDCLNNNNILMERFNNNALSIKNKLDNIKLIMTIHSDNNVFEDHLELARTKYGGVKWIISKFISKQLHQTFDTLSFKIKGTDYSEFSQNIYYEADKNILSTNSLDPYKWVNTLIEDQKINDIRDQLTTTKSYKSISDQDKKSLILSLTPKHIIAWNGIKENVIKKRLIVFDPDNLFLGEPYFLLFNDLYGISKDNDRFITRSDFINLSASKLNRKYKDIAQQYDYTFFDHSVALKWKVPVDDYLKASNDLTLIDLNSDKELNNMLDEIENKWFNHKIFKTLDDVLNQIEDSKTKYINCRLGKSADQPNLHSCCYHVDGGDRWKAVNDSDEFDSKLGGREQKYLNEVFGPQIGRQFDQKGNYNIIHIGVGSGVEIESIINNVSTRTRKIYEYILVDISQNIIERTLEKINQLRGDSKIPASINFHPIIMDVTSHDPVYNSKWTSTLRYNKNNFPFIIILVANGYLLSQKSLLTNIYHFMGAGDYLLVTTEINDKQDSAAHEKIIATYFDKPVLELFSICLRPLDIATSERQYYDFKFPSLNDGEKGEPYCSYKQDILEGYFDLKLWRDKQREKYPNFTFESIKDNSINSYFMTTEDRLKIFQSYKPSSIESINDYLATIGNQWKIENEIDVIEAFNKRSPYNQVGIVIKKL